MFDATKASAVKANSKLDDSVHSVRQIYLQDHAIHTLGVQRTDLTGCLGAFSAAVDCPIRLEGKCYNRSLCR